jgi:putative restriction endonuclease
MFVDELTESTAVLRAAEEYRRLGQRAFLKKHGIGAVYRYHVVVDDQLHDAAAIAGVAFNYQHSSRETDSPRSARSNDSESTIVSALTRLGFSVVNSEPATAAEEATWRLAVADHLRHRQDANGYVTPGLLREWGVYGGAQGVWVDAKRTSKIDPVGIAVGVLHTGRHYADDLGRDGIIYHYPTTNRGLNRDASEVAAMQRASELRVPVYVISDPKPKSSFRQVRIAWIDGWDDASRVFSLTFGVTPPRILQTHDDSDEQDFNAFGSTSRNSVKSTRVRPGQHRFKLRVIQRYGMRCHLTGVTVPEMLEAAHFIPDSSGGSTDPRNGLLMNAALHRAFDAGLFTINPETYAVECRPGLTPQDLGLRTTTIADLPKKPHPEALRWRHAWWEKQPKNTM